MNANVAIIGGGVAGAATALELAKAGVSVALIEKEASNDWKIGEGLPPAAKPMLQQLGIWEPFIADGHLASYGNCSAWGSNGLIDQSFVFNPLGNGWHLDRSRFDRMLLDAAVEAGAKLFSGAAVADCQRADSGWRLKLSNAETIKADFVVDASGRRSWFARQQGAQRTSFDNLVAVAAMMGTKSETIDQDSLTMVEAVVEGWWYAALIPGMKLVAVYLSDADLESTRLARTSEGWLSLLNQTVHLRNRIERHGYRFKLEPRIVSASSSRLDFATGDSWLAVGDAANAFDPLSSQGIVTALESGILAAESILTGQPQTLKSYSDRLEQIFAAYLNSRNFYYSQERRWPDSTFWQRRHGAKNDSTFD